MGAEKTYGPIIDSNNNESNWAQLQSYTIDAIRFPLIVMVVFVHINPEVTCISNIKFSECSIHGLLNLLEIGCSTLISSVAVPTFFCVSGFLFFKNFSSWSWGRYYEKLRRRFRTICIPYFLWNAISFVLIAGALFASEQWGNGTPNSFAEFCGGSWHHIFYNYYKWRAGINWIGIEQYLTGPFDLPLWFLRDLMFVFAFAPAIFYGIRSCNLTFIAFLFLVSTSRILPQMPGINMQAFFFFSVGSYFAINNKNIVMFSIDNRRIVMPTCLILLLLSLLFYGLESPLFDCIQSVFKVFGVFAILFLTARVVVKYKYIPKKSLASLCFFVYAVHGANFPIIGSVIQLMCKFTNQVFINPFLSYFLTPVFTILLCVVLYIALYKILPGSIRILTGNR